MKRLGEGLYLRSDGVVVYDSYVSDLSKNRGHLDYHIETYATVLDEKGVIKTRCFRRFANSIRWVSIEKHNLTPQTIKVIRTPKFEYTKELTPAILDFTGNKNVEVYGKIFPIELRMLILSGYSVRFMRGRIGECTC